MLTSLKVLGQQTSSQLKNTKNPVYVFKYDKKIDEILYKKYAGKDTIVGFEILLNKEKVTFISFRINKNVKLKVNTTRKELEEIVKNDNINKQPSYYIYTKRKGIFYPVDHIVFRAIYCN